MIFDHFQRLLFELAEHRRTVGMSDRMGYVHEVKQAGGEQKVRVVMGIKKDGSPWLSPWLHTTDHRGSSREQQQFKKGQNVRISAVGADFRNATVTPGAEGKSFPQPDHAPGINGDTFQLDKLRISKNGGKEGGSHFYDVWLADSSSEPPEHEDQSGQSQYGSGSGGSGGGGGEQRGEGAGGGGSGSGGGTAAMKVRVSESGYITGRVGNDDNACRFAAHEKGAKIRIGPNTIFVDKQGCWATEPIKIKNDPIPNDNS